MAKLLEHQEKTMEKAHSIKIKNLKTVAMQEAIDFVKRQSDELVKLLTKEHHRMAKQFIHFKDKTEFYITKI